MTHYYIYTAEGPDVGSGLEERVKFDYDGSEDELEKLLNTIGYNLCVENFEMYQDTQEYEEENGVEFEADYYFTPITKEEYENCGLNDLELDL